MLVFHFFETMNSDPARKIQTACQACNKRFSVPARGIGKQVDCPACKKRFTIQPVESPTPSKPEQPAPQIQPKTTNSSDSHSAAARRSSSQTKTDAGSGKKPTRKQTKARIIEDKKQQLGNCFVDEKIMRPIVKIGYMLALLLTSLLMLLLPVVYVGMIVLTILGVIYHAINHTGIIHAPGFGIGPMIIKTLLYIGPIFGGVMVVFFMIKPIFARPTQKYTRRYITRAGEPVLFWFIDQICERVKAPTPNRVYVDCEPNAAASYRQGFFSMLVGSDLALHIGMPLVSSLNTQQLAGILAHEFGHFSQGAGMRLTYIVRSINHWFARVAHQRDSWDVWLAESAGNSHWTISLLFLFAMLCVAISRLILLVFAYIGHIICCAMMRQMEYDADRFEVGLSGSKNFETTTKRLQLIMTVFKSVFVDIIKNVQSKKVMKDIPEVVFRRVEEVPRESVNKLNREASQVTTGIFDSHPANRERIKAAQKLDLDGIFACDHPARELFLDYEKLCNQVSEDFYRSALGISTRKRGRGKKEKDWMLEQV